MRVLQPSTGSPTPESIRALASLFGGTGGFVSHDTILAVVRLPRSVLTTRLYSLFPRHTLEAFLTTLANVHARADIVLQVYALFPAAVHVEDAKGRSPLGNGVTFR